MGIEIERKYLVKTHKLPDLGMARSQVITQGYLSTSIDSTVRVRIAKYTDRYEPRGYLTVKGKNTGIVRTEFEYKIPIDDAVCMMEMCEHTVEKIRFMIGRWELDVFEGANNGLVIAEIELVDADEEIELPEWVGAEVSDDPKYYNLNLALNPMKFRSEDK